MKRAFSRAPHPAAWALILFCAGCTPYNVEHRDLKPSAPGLDTLILTTYQDASPCIKVVFSDTNTMPVSFSVYRTGANSSEFPQTPLVTGIPADKSFYPDRQLPTDHFNAYDRYTYKIHAVSLQDSASDPSNSRSIDLVDTPPIIDSVRTGGGHPTVYYRIDGQAMGFDYTLEIVKNDSVLASWPESDLFNVLYVTAHTFSEINVDSLRAKTRPPDNGVYGVRLLVIVSASAASAYGIDVDTFSVLNP
jgi:hypothetical protein